MNTFTYAEIARREEGRQARGTADVADDSEPIAGGWMSCSGPGSWSNQAAGVGLDGPVSDEDLDRLVDFYVSRGVEPRIEVCPFVHDSLTSGLAARGFRVTAFVNVLARELDAGEDLRARHPHGWPEALELVRVDPSDDDLLRTYIDVSTSGFRPEGTDVDAEMTRITTRMVEHPRSTSYLARIDGEAAGGGALEVGGDAVGLYGTSVVPAYRRRGIQAALILHRLEHARGLGCRIATIQSRPGVPTERNARRVGFAMAYTKVVMVRPGSGLAPSL